LTVHRPAVHAKRAIARRGIADERVCEYEGKRRVVGNDRNLKAPIIETNPVVPHVPMPNCWVGVEAYDV
jgi:hypothetical protein